MNLLEEISVGVENDLTFDREENLVNNDKIKLTEQKRRKDGKHIWTEVVVQKIIIDGKPLALSVSRDISERMKIQKNLKDSEARLRSLLNALPDMLFVFDREGRYLEYHTDSTRKLIMPPELFLNKKVMDVMPFELASRTMDFLTVCDTVSRLSGGVFLCYGSAVMGPEVYLKALSMARNVAHQRGERINQFTTAVFDLINLGEADIHSEASKDDPRYYYRPYKTILVRTVQDGGESFYFRGDHRATFPALYRQVIDD